MIALNVPEVTRCGVEIGAVCASWSLIGLALGTLALVLVNALRGLGQQARGLGGQGSSQPQGGFAGIPPRVSLVRIAPPPEPRSRRH